MTSNCQNIFGHHILPLLDSTPISNRQVQCPYVRWSKAMMYKPKRLFSWPFLDLSYCNYPRMGLSPQEGIHETNFYGIYIMWQENARLAQTKPNFCLLETRRVVREAAISFIKTVVIERLLCPDLVPGTEGTPANKTDKSPKRQGVSILVEGDRQ